jgi:hypothetical protein
MRQNATPFYLRGQSAESASQAKRAKLSDTNAPEILINDMFEGKICVFNPGFLAEPAKEARKALIELVLVHEE